MGLDQKEDLFSRYTSGECSDENLDDGYLSRESFDENMDGFWKFSCEMGNIHDHRRKESEMCVENIADMLPNDPFNMEFSATVTTITSWIEELEKDLGLKSLGFVETDEGEVKKVDNYLVAEVNFVWNSSVRIHPGFDKDAMNAAMDLDNGLRDGHILVDGEIEEVMGFSYEKYVISSDPAKKNESCSEDFCDGDGDSPPPGLFFTLSYLEVEDLLSVEKVCKELRSAVRDDPLPWRNIHIGHPLSYKITDDALIKLTDRAQGMLQSLTLVDCLHITDTGLMQVLQRNPRLTKLSVPGCIRLRIDGILHKLKVFKSIGSPGIKHLRLGGIFGATNQHFEKLKLLLGADNCNKSTVHKPRLYRAGQMHLSFDDECAIDIETCPKCQEIRQVYDCPAESCQGKHQASHSCRACILCTARCIHCGRCLNNCDYEETFCLDLLCLDCQQQFLDFRETSAGITTSPKHRILHTRASYHFYLRG